MESTTTAPPARPKQPRISPARRTALLQAWTEEQAAARSARARGDVTSEWNHLERAHILSQPMVGPHVRTHLMMLSTGVRRRDRREILGQLARLVLAGPGSLSGRYPVGNTGAASVSAFVPMPIPDDLRAILDGRDIADPTR